MHKKLVNDKQPFGEHHNLRIHGGSPVERGGRNAVSASTEIYNNHKNQPQSMADKAPNAHAIACAHGNDPFYWFGHPGR